MRSGLYTISRTTAENPSSETAGIPVLYYYAISFKKYLGQDGVPETYDDCSWNPPV